MSHPGPALGRVACFDPAAGLGELVLDDGTKVGFHCTQVADGSRHIDAGVRVRAVLRPARRGRLEAFWVEPCP